MICPCCNLRSITSKKWSLCHACDERRRRNGGEIAPKPRLSREAARALFQASPNDPRHGSSNGYTNLLCRCARCTEAWRHAHKAYMHADPKRLENHALRQAQSRERKKTSK